MINQLFFHTKAAHGKVRVTVSAVIQNGNAHFGVSRCSANDSFNKKKGRLIASGRANKAPFTITEAPEQGLTTWFLDKAKTIAEKVIAKPELVH